MSQLIIEAIVGDEMGRWHGGWDVRVFRDASPMRLELGFAPVGHLALHLVLHLVLHLALHHGSLRTKRDIAGMDTVGRKILLLAEAGRRLARRVVTAEHVWRRRALVLRLCLGMWGSHV